MEQDSRMRSIGVYRPLRGGGHAGTYFLIDYDCIGLKDAFVRTQVEVIDEREWMRERAAADGVTLVTMKLEEVRREVAGAIRWTKAHRFRLPTALEKCLRVIDGAGDVENADVKAFGTEDGGLYYLGYESDLARRLMEETVDDFLEREDVSYAFVEDLRAEDEGMAEDEWDMAEDEWDEEAEEPIDPEDLKERLGQLDEVTRKLEDDVVERVKGWCQANGREVEPGLRAAAHLFAQLAVGRYVMRDREEVGGQKVEELLRGVAETRMGALPREMRESASRALELIATYGQGLPAGEPPLTAVLDTWAEKPDEAEGG
jgi:hypothetical protein